MQTRKHGETTFMADPRISEKVTIVTDRFDEITVPFANLKAFVEARAWVSVKDRLPAEDGRYLVHCPCADPAMPLISVAWYHPDEGRWSLLIPQWIAAISHWMDVPKTPEAS